MAKKRDPDVHLVVTVEELRAVLAEGWTIDPPVNCRPAVDRSQAARYCDVILWRAGRVRVLTVPDDAALRGLLAEHGAQIVETGRILKNS
jgi:hypothetical protein